MSTPLDEKSLPIYDAGVQPLNLNSATGVRLSSEETYSGAATMPGSPNSLRPVETNVSRHGGGGATSSIYSSSKAREEILRPSDDVELARAEMMARKQSVAGKGGHGILAMPGERSETPTDELDDRTNPVHNVRKAWKPPKEPTTGTAKFFKRVSKVLVSWGSLLHLWHYGTKGDYV